MLRSVVGRQSYDLNCFFFGYFSVKYGVRKKITKSVSGYFRTKKKNIKRPPRSGERGQDLIMARPLRKKTFFTAFLKRKENKFLSQTYM